MPGLIPRPFIDELLHRTEITELIDAYLPLKKQGNSFVACCPFHHEKTPSFNVSQKKQFYYCFGCGASGNAISFIMGFLKQEFPDAITTLASRLGLSVPVENHSEQNKSSKSLSTLLTQVASFYQKNLKASTQVAIQYLKQRGVSGEIAYQYQLGFAPEGWHTLQNQFPKEQQGLLETGMIIKNSNNKYYDRYRQRLMFPIHNRQGNIIGFGGRALFPEQKPKYLNSPETTIFQKNHELYGLYQALQKESTQENIIIVEGYLDVIALAQFGINNAVATLGTATSGYHIQLLKKYTKTLLFCFDGDLAGEKAAWRALEHTLPYLDSGLEAKFIFLPPEHDPDSFIRLYGKEKFLEQMVNALPINRFLIDRLIQKINIKTPAGKSALLNQIKPFLQKMPECAYQETIYQELASLTRIEQHRIRQLLLLPDEKKLFKNQAIVRTPLRLATALLLQQPEIYKRCINKIPSVNEKKFPILYKIISLLATHPNMTTGMLLEFWRDSRYFSALNQLAIWEHQVPQETVDQELIDTLIFLNKQNKEETIEQLMAKSRKEGLSITEQKNLQALLSARHLKATD